MMRSKLFSKGLFIFFFILIVKGYFLFSVYKNQSLSDFVIFNKTLSIEEDGHHNLMIAKNLLDHFTYSDSNSNVPSEYAVWRPPLWPLILAFLLLISQKLFITLLLKVLLETLIIVWIFNKLQKKGFVKTLWILPILLLEPQYQKYSITFLSESISAIIMLYALYLFLKLNAQKRTNKYIPIVLAAMILCHPVSIFFVLTLFFFYIIFAIRTDLKTVGIHTLLFVVLMMIWPIRNQLTFDQGMFITASQGTTFSKGWNDLVAQDFNNVNGDLADADLNLKYLTPEEIQEAKGTIAKSKLYKEATGRFFDQLTFSEKITIAGVKLRSNFNPFPELKKEGLLEKMSIVFRILYLIVFVQSIVYILRRRKFQWGDTKNNIAFFVVAVISGQIIISVLAYTGIRFKCNIFSSFTIKFYHIQL